MNPNLLSKTAIHIADNDPSIDIAALGAGPEHLENDLNTFGFVFETLCIRDLCVYTESIDDEVYHYRDKDGLECDVVIHLRNGSYGLVIIKLGGKTLIEEGGKNLKKLVMKIDKDKMNEPSFNGFD